MDDTTDKVNRTFLLHMVRLACRMRGLLDRVARGDSIQAVHRRQAAECVAALQEAADWMQSGLGAAPPVWKPEPTRKQKVKFPLNSGSLPMEAERPLSRAIKFRRRQSGSDVVERIKLVQQLLIQSGPETVASICLATGLTQMQVRFALEQGQFVREGKYPARYSVQVASVA